MYLYWAYLKKMIKSLSIVFPIFNESKRLKYCFQDIDIFNASNYVKQVEYIFVDDGSTDDSYKKIILFIQNKKKEKNKNLYKVLRVKKNSGKGAALKKGVEKAKKEWILTIDTDISVSLSQINSWVKKKFIKKKSEILFGSRNLKNSIVKYEYHRKIIGIIFIFISKIFFKIRLHDTQCGFKLYKKKIAKKIFSELKEKKFAHDIEIILLANKKKISIEELPVKWIHKDDSKINLIKDSMNIFFALIKIKKKFN